MMTLGDVCTKGTSNIAQKDLDAHDGTYPIYGASGLIKYVDLLIKHIDLSSSETLNYINGWRLFDTNKRIDKKNVSKEEF